MKIGLIEVDRLTFPRMTFPNLALMKISAWHKERGDTVKWCDNPLERFDLVYQTKVFDETYSADIEWIPNADKVIRGGSGYGLYNALPYDVEHIMPDYSLYDGTPAKICDTAYGFLTRGCPRKCPWCIVGDKEGTRSRKVSNLWEFWGGAEKHHFDGPESACLPGLARTDDAADRFRRVGGLQSGAGYPAAGQDKNHVSEPYQNEAAPFRVGRSEERPDRTLSAVRQSDGDQRPQAQKECRVFNAKGIEAISNILDVVGVDTWEQLNGKFIRVKYEGLGSTIEEIWNLMSDKWFNIREYFVIGEGYGHGE